MAGKKLAVWGCLLGLVAFFAGGVALADDLADVQKRIKDRDFKWVAKHHANPEKKGLGLLKDGFTSYVPPAVSENQILLGLSPASLDWRNLDAGNVLGVLPGNYVSPVKNQGSCGSCWAFATTATAESATQIALNDPIASGNAYNLSEQVMLTCSGAGSCNGGYVTSASSYIANTGLLREDPAGCYAYNTSSTTCPNPTSYPGCDQTRYRIDSWSGVSANVEALKNALNNYGPLVATYAVYNDFYRYYSGGVYEATSCDQAVNPLVGYHAVSVVGYQDADATHPVGYFIVKNSWGTSWGETAGGTEKGYFRIGYSQVGNCVGFGGSTLAYSKTACNGDISVASPTALQAGTVYPIAWSATGSIGLYVKIELYQNGKLFRTIKSSTPAADGSYQWTVDSDLNGTGFAVMVTSTTCSSASGTSGDFTINPAVSFQVSGDVTSGGSGLSGVTIGFGRVSGTGALPASVATDGNGVWSQTGFQQGTVYRATPTKTGCSFSPTSWEFSGASSSLDFTVVENKITAVISPVSSSSWKAGSTNTVRWTYTGSPGPYVKVELIGANASAVLSSRTKIGSGGAGSYNWRISKGQTPGSYQIKVTSTTNGSSATSAGFTITK